jgi:hypothetical protein
MSRRAAAAAASATIANMVASENGERITADHGIIPPACPAAAAARDQGEDGKGLLQGSSIRCCGVASTREDSCADTVDCGGRLEPPCSAGE